MMVLIMRKSVKSLQLILNEISHQLGLSSISQSAFSQRRVQLKHTAFIELNQKAVVEVKYGDDEFKRYKGMRVLGIDGSKILLPNTVDVINTFGCIRYSNDHPEVQGAHAYGLASVMYDVLNRIALDSQLGTARAYEVDLAREHLVYTHEKDLIVCDRNYSSYSWLATLHQANRAYVIRCSAASFATARSMLRGVGSDSQIITLKPHHSKLKEIKQQELPESITVRLARVVLNTGEYEVLVTSLLDEHEYPTTEFKSLYALRWGEETFYGILKTRLNLENFTGKTAEAVYQDFYASVYLTGLESILTAECDTFLGQKLTRYPQQVNRAVSFHAIKNQAIEILYSHYDNDLVLKKLEELFLTNPISNRKNRQVPRKKRSARQLLHYAKRRCKICF